ncbi:hypothetical protein EDD21DRAFT_177216 [Dissophora ornata]|nr:hypothetical protein EDD21DRAFT_177216 [Dissophora ornata]
MAHYCLTLMLIIKGNSVTARLLFYGTTFLCLPRFFSVCYDWLVTLPTGNNKPHCDTTAPPWSLMNRPQFSRFARLRDRTNTSSSRSSSSSSSSS